MAKQRQKNLALAIAENAVSDKPKSAKEVLESVGYPTSTAESQAKNVIEQKGVIEELEKLGFTEHKAKEVVASIMTDETEESNARLKAADMTFKVHGSYAPEKTIAVSVKGDVKDYAKYMEVKEKFEVELLDKLQNEDADFRPNINP